MDNWAEVLKAFMELLTALAWPLAAFLIVIKLRGKVKK